MAAHDIKRCNLVNRTLEERQHSLDINEWQLAACTPEEDELMYNYLCAVRALILRHDHTRRPAAARKLAQPQQAVSAGLLN